MHDQCAPAITPIALPYGWSTSCGDSRVVPAAGDGTRPDVHKPAISSSSRQSVVGDGFSDGLGFGTEGYAGYGAGLGTTGFGTGFGAGFGPGFATGDGVGAGVTGVGARVGAGVGAGVGTGVDATAD